MKVNAAQCISAVAALLIGSALAADSNITSTASSTELVYSREKISELQARIEANDKRYEQRFSDQEKAVNAALQAADKAVNAALQASKEAVNKAEIANEKRLDSVNEFRRTLSDQAAGFATKDSTSAQFTAVTKDIAEIKQRVERGEGSAAGVGASWVWLLGAIAAVGTLITVFTLLARDRKVADERRSQGIRAAK